MDITTKIGIGFAISSGLSYVGLSQESLVIYGVLMMVDMITGVSASYFIDKSTVRSNKAMLGAVKKLVMLMIPFVIGLVLKGMGRDQSLVTWFVSTCVSVFIAIEGYSIIGNIYTIKTGKKVEEIDATEKLIKAFLSLLKKNIDKSIESVETKEVLDQTKKDA